MTSWGSVLMLYKHWCGYFWSSWTKWSSSTLSSISLLWNKASNYRPGYRLSSFLTWLTPDDYWKVDECSESNTKNQPLVVKIKVVVPAVVTRMNVEVSLWHRLKTVSEAVPSKAFLGNRLVYCMCWPNLGCYGGTQRGIAPLPLPRDAGMFDLGFSSKARQENSTST